MNSIEKIYKNVIFILFFRSLCKCNDVKNAVCYGDGGNNGGIIIVICACTLKTV